MTEAMKITLSTQPADGRWGEKATWSINNDGIALHLNGKDDLGLIQRAARKIDGMGIKHVALSGEGWNTDRAWAFWAGYKGPKGQRQVEWPSLDDAQRSELDNRLTIIDWVRDTINAPAEELGPEQLAQRAVDLLCGVAGEKISYRITKGEDLREQAILGCIPWAAAPSVRRSCWRWTITRPAIKRRRYTPAWWAKASPLIPAATALNRAPLWIR